MHGAVGKIPGKHGGGELQEECHDVRVGMRGEKLRHVGAGVDEFGGADEGGRLREVEAGEGGRFLRF